MPPDPNPNAMIRLLAQRVQAMQAQQQAIVGKYNELVVALQDQPRSITQEIDSIPGRRIFYTLAATLPFTADFAGTRATALSFLVSQDGAFIATHYPLAIWRPTAPAGATNFGAWRPVSTWPLPDQVLDTDLIDLSYEVNDTGSQRNFQNQAVAPIFSRPDNLIPLPVPTMFAPNTTIQFIPTFERVDFNATGTPTTEGTLWVGFPGYKIVNL